MPRQIFRKEALDRLSSPEQLDQLMQLTSPRGWVLLGAFGLLLLGAVIWGLFGSIPVTAQGQGFLMRSQGIWPVVAGRKGVIGKIQVHVGDKVEKGAKLMVFTPVEGDQAQSAIVCPFPAHVLEVSVREEDHVAEDATLVILERQGDPLQAVLYVPVAEGYQAAPGMKVEVWPEPTSKGGGAPLTGRVFSAGKFPVEPSEIQRRLQSDQLASTLVKAGPSLEVVVGVDADPGDSGGATHWYSGTPCQGRITILSQCPIQLMFPTSGPPGT